MNFRLDTAVYRQKLHLYNEPLVWKLAYITACLQEKTYPEGWSKEELIVEHLKLQKELETTGFIGS